MLLIAFSNEKEKENMSKLGQAVNHGNCVEQIVNLLYTTGYRLTGNHKSTQALLTGVFNALSCNINIKTALKNLCLLYINETTANPGKKTPKGKSSSPARDNRTNKIQEALLTLPPTERLVLVLRDVLGLTYAEIAELSGMENTAVTRLMNAGRWALRKQLAPPPKHSRLPEETLKH